MSMASLDQQQNERSNTLEGLLRGGIRVELIEPGPSNASRWAVWLRALNKPISIWILNAFLLTFISWIVTQVFVPMLESYERAQRVESEVHGRVLQWASQTSSIPDGQSCSSEWVLLTNRPLDLQEARQRQSNQDATVYSIVPEFSSVPLLALISDYNYLSVGGDYDSISSILSEYNSIDSTYSSGGVVICREVRDFICSLSGFFGAPELAPPDDCSSAPSTSIP